MKQTSQYQAMKQEGILLNANESSVNLPLAIREEIAQAIQGTAFNRYPQDDYTALREAYARYLQLQPEQIIAGNGSDEMLGLMIGLYIGKGKKLYTLAPDFSMYDYYCGMHDGEMCRWTIKPGEAFDTEGFIAYGRQEQVLPRRAVPCRVRTESGFRLPSAFYRGQIPEGGSAQDHTDAAAGTPEKR